MVRDVKELSVSRRMRDGDIERSRRRAERTRRQRRIGAQPRGLYETEGQQMTNTIVDQQLPTEGESHDE